MLLSTLFFAYAEARLVVNLTPVRSFIDFRVDSLEVDFELTNVGQEAVHFQPWDTPLFGLEADLFKVIDYTDQELEYGGIHVLRDTDVDETIDASKYLVTIQPGETKSARVDLTGSYLIPIDGLVTISMKYSASEADMNEIAVHVAHTESQEARFMSTLNPDGLKTFTSCSSSQRSTITGSLSTARGQSTRARNCVSSTSGPITGCRTIYNTWYGSLSSSRHSTIRTCWSNIHNNLPRAQFDCSNSGSMCRQGYVAWVWLSDRSMTIHLCRGWFGMSTSGRGRLLNHEQSHFRHGGCGTVDHTYGRSSSQSLARNDPARAIQNADNHMYFGEDVR
jgi:peptidyl-Lys metalloendopeptidase